MRHAAVVGRRPTRTVSATFFRDPPSRTCYRMLGMEQAVRRSTYISQRYPPDTLPPASGSVIPSPLQPTHRAGGHGCVVGPRLPAVSCREPAKSVRTTCRDRCERRAVNRDTAFNQRVRGQQADLAITVHRRHSTISAYGVSTRVPGACPRAELTGAARALRRHQGRRDPGPASQGRRAAPAPPTSDAELGRPRTAHGRGRDRPDSRSTRRATRPARHPSDDSRPSPPDQPSAVVDRPTLAELRIGRGRAPPGRRLRQNNGLRRGREPHRATAPGCQAVVRRISAHSHHKHQTRDNTRPLRCSQGWS
jgi:hypothetical protein